jgi:hypothetical protein
MSTEIGTISANTVVSLNSGFVSVNSEHSISHQNFGVLTGNYNPAAGEFSILGSSLPSTPFSGYSSGASHGERRTLRMRLPSLGTSPTLPVGWYDEENTTTPGSPEIRMYSRSSGPTVSPAYIAMGSRTRDYFIVKGDFREMGSANTYSTVAPHTHGALTSPSLFTNNSLLPTMQGGAGTPFGGGGVTTFTPGAMWARQMVLNNTPLGAAHTNLTPSIVPSFNSRVWGGLFVNQLSPAGTPSTDFAPVRVVASSPTGTKYFLAFASGSTEVGSINSPGTTTTYSTSSDYRLKNEVQDLNDGLDIVEKLRPRVWKWKTDDTPGVGFIAHEIQEAVPNAPTIGLVTGEKDAVIRIGKLVDSGGNTHAESIEETEDENIKSEWANNGLTWVETHSRGNYQSVDTSFIIPHLVASIKELKTKINSLEERIIVLESGS